MAIDLNTIIENINSLSESVNSNVFITSAREAFKTGIEEYEISDEERAKLMATYEAQVSVGVIGQIMAMVKELPEISARTDLTNEQISVSKEQNKKLILEQEETKARIKKHYGIEVLIGENLAITRTDNKNGMMDKQIITEMWRHRDLQAGVNIKNKSAYATLESAKFEEARRHIAIKANQDNMYLKKADYKVNQLNAMAMDDDYIITADQIGDVKSTIDAVPTGVIEYNSSITTNITEVPTNEITL